MKEIDKKDVVQVNKVHTQKMNLITAAASQGSGFFALLWVNWLLASFLLGTALQNKDDLGPILLVLLCAGLEAVDQHRVERLEELLVLALGPEQPLLGLQVDAFL